MSHGSGIFNCAPEDEGKNLLASSSLGYPQTKRY